MSQFKGNGFFNHARRHHQLHPRRPVPGQRGTIVTCGPSIANADVTNFATPITTSVACRERHGVTEFGHGSPDVGTIALWLCKSAGLDPKDGNLLQASLRSSLKLAHPVLTGWARSCKVLWNLNVNVVRAGMIQTQRAYEMNSKTIQTSRCCKTGAIVSSIMITLAPSWLTSGQLQRCC
jgi:flagellar basal body rod protein FlgG